MSKYRQAARIDDNQNNIVEALIKLGYSVVKGHDDILVGSKGKTYWFEIKNPDTALNKSGSFKSGAIKTSQKKLLDSWNGHYSIVSTLEEMLEQIK